MKTETQISERELELISRSLDESLSELERRRLNQKILDKEEAVQALTRYQAISAVMNKQFPAQIDKDFSQRVMQVIESDGRQDEEPVRSGIHKVTSSFRHFAGLAVAASVATISVMSYQYFNSPTPANDPNSLLTSEQVQPTNPTSTVPSLAVEFSPAQLSSEQVNNPQQNSKVVPQVEENIYYQQMSPYIQDHSGFGSKRFITPYVEIIELKDVQE